jgi:pyridoxine 4-dehydrogenase
VRISTKVGFFPIPGGVVEHCLDPTRLRDAVERSATTLGVAPWRVLLHNPERSLARRPHQEAGDVLAAACAVLDRASEQGWCAGWGISTWLPSQLLAPLSQLPPGARPRPAALMVRSGLTVPGVELRAAEQVAAALGVGPGQRWGMAPFGGQPRDHVWNPSVTGAFLASGQAATPLQVALRVAFELPTVARVAVGASTPAQLRQLVDAADLSLRPGVVDDYRRMISGGGTPPR